MAYESQYKLVLIGHRLHIGTIDEDALSLPLSCPEVLCSLQ